MKRHWETEELIDFWTLLPPDLEVLANKTGATRLGFAVLLKFFALEGRFPRFSSEIPTVVVKFITKQVQVNSPLFVEYRWQSRAVVYHLLFLRWLLVKTSLSQNKLSPYNFIHIYFAAASIIACAACSMSGEIISSPADFALALYCLVRVAVEPLFDLMSSVISSFGLTLVVAFAAVVIAVEASLASSGTNSTFEPFKYSLRVFLIAAANSCAFKPSPILPVFTPAIPMRTVPSFFAPTVVESVDFDWLRFLMF